MKKSRIITIYTDDIQGIVSKFNDDIISEDLHNYIMHQCLGLSVQGKLTLRFIGKLNSSEQEQIKASIQNYYRFHMEHYKNIDKYDEWIRLALFIIGIVLIFVSKWFNYIINELILIIGWLAIWELGYDILFDKRKRKRDYYRYKQIYSSKIEFAKDNSRCL